MQWPFDNKRNNNLYLQRPFGLMCSYNNQYINVRADGRVETLFMNVKILKQQKFTDSMITNVLAMFFTLIGYTSLLFVWRKVLYQTTVFSQNWKIFHTTFQNLNNFTFYVFRWNQSWNKCFREFEPFNSYIERFFWKITGRNRTDFQESHLYVSRKVMQD